MSGRKLGIVVRSASPPSGSLVMPMAASFSAACDSGMSNPVSRDSPLPVSDTRRVSCGCGWRSIPSPATAPPPSRASIARRPAAGQRDAGGVDAALETVRSLAAQPQPLRRAADGARIERRRLQHDRRRRGGHLAVGAAHHARQRDRAALVGDDDVTFLQRAVDAVQRRHPLAARRRAGSGCRRAACRRRTRAAGGPAPASRSWSRRPGSRSRASRTPPAAPASTADWGRR